MKTMGRSPAAFLLVAALAAGAAWLVRTGFDGEPGVVPSAPRGAGPRPGVMDGGVALPAAARGPGALPAAADCRGLTPAQRGSWSVERGYLRPSEDLRDRFEGYLSHDDVASPRQLRDCLAQDAAKDLGPAAALAVTDLWDRYLSVRNRAWQHKLLRDDPRSWQPAIDERRRVRQQVLGPAWADAFYATEDRVLANALGPAAADGPSPALTQAILGTTGAPDAATLRAQRVAMFGEHATGELDAAQARQEQWQRRLQEARREWMRLRGPGVRPGARGDPQAAMQAYLREHFDADEQPRVEITLALEEAGAAPEAQAKRPPPAR